MPTNKPRISITLSPADLVILDRFAKATGSPRATVLSGLIGSVLPELLKSAELIELANSAPKKVHEELVQSLSDATLDAMGFLESNHRSYRRAMTMVQRPAGAGERATKERTARAIPSAAPGPRPPPTNRGVKT